MSGHQVVVALAAERAAVLRRPVPITAVLVDAKEAAGILGVPLWRLRDPAFGLLLGRIDVTGTVRYRRAAVQGWASRWGEWRGARLEHELAGSRRGGPSLADAMRHAKPLLSAPPTLPSPGGEEGE